MTAAPASDGATRRRRRLPMFTEVLIALVAVALVQAFLVKPFGVPSQSMEQTLHIGDRILVNRLDHDAARGDVVVFGHGDTWQAAAGPAGRQPRHARPARRSVTSPASGRATRPTRSSA